jgi:hypothetical protein
VDYSSFFLELNFIGPIGGTDILLVLWRRRDACATRKSPFFSRAQHSFLFVLYNLDKEVFELAAKIQENFEELGI